VKKDVCSKRNQFKLIQAGLDIDERTAKQANSLGFFPSRLIFIPLPASDPNNTQYSRTNGRWELTLNSSAYGLPYGIYPRLEMAGLVSLAVKTQSPELQLKPISQHLREFGIAPTGGERGTIQAYRNQLLRLFTCSINCFMDTKDIAKGRNFFLIDEYELWTRKTERQQQTDDVLPFVKLSQSFFEEITGSEHTKGTAVPFDLRAIKALKSSTLQIDLYLFLTYRFHALRTDKLIPWLSLKQQFGAGYADTNDALRNFKKKLIQALKRVLVVYPEANIGLDDAGLWLKRGKAHV